MEYILDRFGRICRMNCILGFALCGVEPSRLEWKYNQILVIHAGLERAHDGIYMRILEYGSLYGQVRK